MCQSQQKPKSVIFVPFHPPLHFSHYTLPKEMDGAKRHRNKRKGEMDALNGITKPAIKRLSWRGGIKRVGANLFKPLRDKLQEDLLAVLGHSITMTTHRNRETVSAMDVVFGGLRRKGINFYGAEDAQRKKKLKKRITSNTTIVESDEEAEEQQLQHQQEEEEEGEEGEEMPVQTRPRLDKETKKAAAAAQAKAKEAAKRKRRCLDSDDEEEPEPPIIVDKTGENWACEVRTRPENRDQFEAVEADPADGMTLLRTFVNSKAANEEDDPVPPVAPHTMKLLDECGWDLGKFKAARPETILVYIRRIDDKKVCGAALLRVHSKIKQVQGQHGEGTQIEDVRGLTLLSEDKGRPSAPFNYDLNKQDYVHFRICDDTRSDCLVPIADQRVRKGMFRLVEVFVVGINQEGRNDESLDDQLSVETVFNLIADKTGLPVAGMKHAFIFVEAPREHRRILWCRIRNMEIVHLTYTRLAGESSQLWVNQTFNMLDDTVRMYPFDASDSELATRFVGIPIPKYPIDIRPKQNVY